MGKINFIESGTDVTVTIDADSSSIAAGGVGGSGRLILRDGEEDTIALEGKLANIAAGGAGKFGTLLLQNQDGGNTVWIDANALVHVGGNGNDGEVILKDGSGGDRICLSAGDGDIRIKNTEGDTLFRFKSSTAGLHIGGEGEEGDVVLRDGSDNERIHLSAGDGDIRIRNATGDTLFRFKSSTAGLHIGGIGEEGDVVLRDDFDNERIHLSAGEGNIRVKSADGNPSIDLNAGDGVIGIKNQEGVTTFLVAYGQVIVGGEGTEGGLVMRDGDGEETIRLDGGSGDIILANADCAEQFNVVDGCLATPGTVVVIDDDERLTVSTREYDRRVAGVVSGAGKYRPGIILDRRPGDSPRPAVALMGKVYCKVDAAHGPVRVGDLLVSSPTTGHAMVATDSARSSGAVLGKALRACKSGRGKIPILVTLQ